MPIIQYQKWVEFLIQLDKSEYQSADLCQSLIFIKLPALRLMNDENIFCKIHLF